MVSCRLLYRPSQRRAHGLNSAPIVASLGAYGQIEPAIEGQGAQEVAEVLQAHFAQGVDLQSEIALIARLAEAHGGHGKSLARGNHRASYAVFDLLSESAA